MFILKKRWWYHLDPEKGGLLKDYALDYLASRLVVQWQRDDGRLYGLFDGYVDFIQFQNQLRPEFRCFHQVIFGTLRRKPVIDFDLEPPYKIDPETLLNILLEKMIEILPEDLDYERDLLIYESVDETKFGAHIVIDNWCLSDHLDARAFTEKLKSLLPEFMREMIDGSVNSSTSHLRMLGSRKYETMRVKRLRQRFKLKGRWIEHKHYMEAHNEKMRENLEMSESLITFTPNCKLLPLYRDPLDDPTNVATQGKKIDDEKVELAIELTQKHDFFKNNDWCYSFDGVKKGYIQMKRLRSSWCSICNKIHDTMGFYLSISGPTERVYYHCWSAIKNHREGAFFLVGELNPDNSQIDNLTVQVDSLAILDNLARVAPSFSDDGPGFVSVPVSLDQILIGQTVNPQTNSTSISKLPAIPALPTPPSFLQQSIILPPIQLFQVPSAISFDNPSTPQVISPQKTKLVISPSKGIVLSPQSAPSFLSGLGPLIPQQQSVLQAPTCLPGFQPVLSPQSPQSPQQQNFNNIPRSGSIQQVIGPQIDHSVQVPNMLPIGPTIQVPQQVQTQQLYQSPIQPQTPPPSSSFKRKVQERKYTYSGRSFGQKANNVQQTQEDPLTSQFRMVANRVDHSAISNLSITLDRTGKGSRFNNLKQIPQIDLKDLNF